MIVRFTTRVGALTLHGDAALALLKAMGHSGRIPGAILAADLPAALASLREHLQRLPHAPAPPPAEGPDEDPDEEREPPVTLHMRAVPLIDMIETAIARNSDLMWEPG